MFVRNLSVRVIASVALAIGSVACEPGPPPAPTGATSPDTVSGADVAAGADTGAATGADPADPLSEPDPLLLTSDGWGPLRIGMSRAEVVAAAGEDANPEAVGGPEPERCDEFRPTDAPDGVLVMIENGILTRISVARNTEIATPAGFSVGDAAGDVVASYGDRAEVTPHKYVDAPARYITVWSESRRDGERRGIRYEVGADDVVTFLRGGGPSIEYVEGCL